MIGTNSYFNSMLFFSIRNIILIFQDSQRVYNFYKQYYSQLSLD
jgi:hypothetical protein